MSDYDTGLRAAYTWPNGETVDAAELIDALIAERDALRTALRKYGAHTESCFVTATSHRSKSCDCGLSALLLSAEKQT